MGEHTAVTVAVHGATEPSAWRRGGKLASVLPLLDRPQVVLRHSLVDGRGGDGGLPERSMIAKVMGALSIISRGVSRPRAVVAGDGRWWEDGGIGDRFLPVVVGWRISWCGCWVLDGWI